MASPSTLRLCGAVGIAGALLAIPADALSWLLADGYSPVRRTISALAVGRASWLIDVGLWAFALACVAVGAGMFALGRPARGWRIAALAIPGAGGAVAVVSLVNGYAGQENAGANIHTWAVYALYVLFAAAALGAAPGLRRLDRGVAEYSRLAGWAWVQLGPVYYFWFPSGWAGAFERGLALLMIAWLALVARRLLREARRPAEAA